MVALPAIKNFGGMLPRTQGRNLPENMAEQAVNCDLAGGDIAGLPAPVLVHTFSGFAARAYRFPDPDGISGDAWLPLPSPYSSVVRSPLANDTTHRIYWTNPGDLAPHWNTFAGVLGSTTSWDLGTVHPPSTSGFKLAVGVTGGAATAVSRSYVYTYVNQFGEESAPNFPSDVASGPPDGAWAITGMPTTAPGSPGGFNYPPITKLRLYRTVTGQTTGAQFYLVREFTYVGDPPTTPYTDTTNDTAITNNPTLISAGWGNPPLRLDGLIAMPGGMLIGFVDNTLHFCEPNRPHAWPAAYDQSVHYKIVSLAVWQQSLVIITQGFPSTGSGTSPANFTITMVRVSEPCVARGSIVTDLAGVYYASQNGLVMLNYYGMQNQTLAFFTKNIWLADFHATQIIACRHRAQYLAINGTETGFLIDYSESRLGVVSLSALTGAVSIWNDDYSGDAYVCAGNKVYLWDSPDSPAITYRWRSKQFYLPAPTSLGACHISLDPSIVDPPPPTPPLDNGDATLDLPDGYNAVFRLFAGPNGEHLIMTKNLLQPREIFRLPSGFKVFDWQCEIVARVPVLSIELASTMKELKGV